MRDRRVLVTMAALGAVTLCLLGCDAGRPSASPAGEAASGPGLGRWLPVRSTGQEQFGPVSCVRGAVGWCTALGMTQGGPSGPVAVVATAKAGVWGRGSRSLGSRRSRPLQATAR